MTYSLDISMHLSCIRKTFMSFLKMFDCLFLQVIWKIVVLARHIFEMMCNQ